MDDLIHLATIWPGVRFAPTEEELVRLYLHRKLRGEEFQQDVIREVKLYDYTPEELINMYPAPTVSNSSYFFTERIRNNESDSYNRRAKEGFWERYGNRTLITDQNEILIAVKKLYRFITSAPGVRHNAEQSVWTMAEYSLDEVDYQGISSDLKGRFVICHISKQRRAKRSMQPQAAPQEAVQGQPIDVMESGQSSTMVGSHLQLPIAVQGQSISVMELGQSSTMVGPDPQLPVDVQESGQTNSLAGPSYYRELAEEENWSGVPNPGEYEGLPFDDFNTWFPGVPPNARAPSVGTLPGTGACDNLDLEDESEAKSPVLKRAKTG